MVSSSSAPPPVTTVNTTPAPGSPGAPIWNVGGSPIDPSLGNMSGGAGFAGGSLPGGPNIIGTQKPPTLSGGISMTVGNGGLTPNQLAALTGGARTTVASAPPPVTITNSGNTSVADSGNTNVNSGNKTTVQAATPVYQGGVPNTPNGPGFVPGISPYQFPGQPPLQFAATPSGQPARIAPTLAPPQVASAGGMPFMPPAMAGPGPGQASLQPQAQVGGGGSNIMGGGSPPGMARMMGAGPPQEAMQRAAQAGPLGGGNPMIAQAAPPGVGGFGQWAAGVGGRSPSAAGYDPRYAQTATDGSGGSPAAAPSGWANDGVNTIGRNGEPGGMAQQPQADSASPDSATLNPHGVPNARDAALARAAGVTRIVNPMTGIPYGSEVAAQFGDEKERVRGLEEKVGLARDKLTGMIQDFNANPSGYNGPGIAPPHRWLHPLSGETKGTWNGEHAYRLALHDQNTTLNQMAARREQVIRMQHMLLQSLEAERDKHLSQLNELGGRMETTLKGDLDRAMKDIDEGKPTMTQRFTIARDIIRTKPGPSQDSLIDFAKGQDPDHADDYEAQRGKYDEQAAVKLEGMQLRNEFAKTTNDLKLQALKNHIAEQQNNLEKFKDLLPTMLATAKDRASMMKSHAAIADITAHFAGQNAALKQQIQTLQVSGYLNAEEAKQAQAASAYVGKWNGLYKTAHDPMSPPDQQLAAQKTLAGMFPGEKDPINSVPASVVEANRKLGAFATKGVTAQGIREAVNNANTAAGFIPAPQVPASIEPGAEQPGAGGVPGGKVPPTPINVDELSKKYPNVVNLLKAGKASDASSAAKISKMSRDQWIALHDHYIHP